MVTLEVWERGGLAKSGPARVRYELKIHAREASAVLCTCKAPGQKGGKQGIGTREKPPFCPVPTFPCPSLPLAAAH